MIESLSRSPIKTRLEVVDYKNSLGFYLESNLSFPFKIKYTKNKTVFISWKMAGGFLSIRIHEIFCNAGFEIFRHVLDFVKKTNLSTSKKALRLFFSEEMLKEKKHELYHIKGGTKNINAQMYCKHAGDHRDLNQIFAKLNLIYFENKLASSIVWMNLRKKNIDYFKKFCLKSIRLGKFDTRTKTIFIHPILDTYEIPVFVLEFVVYHEMLHERLPTKIVNNRKSIHSVEFRLLEKSFKDYEKATSWIRSDLFSHANTYYHGVLKNKKY